MLGAGYARTDETSHEVTAMERYKVEQQRPEYQNGFEQAYYERELAKAMRQMTAREVEKFREWCDRNAVPVVLI